MQCCSGSTMINVGQLVDLSGNTGTFNIGETFDAFRVGTFGKALQSVPLRGREGSLNKKDFPKPNCPVLSAPKLDDQVKDHLKRKGKDSHFGTEKSLYKIQEQLLDVVGPLACLWGNLLNKEANVTAEDTLLLVQRTLVLLGSASHVITMERCKIAWTRINPMLKSLAAEDYDKREVICLGLDFLRKPPRGWRWRRP